MGPLEPGRRGLRAIQTGDPSKPEVIEPRRTRLVDEDIILRLGTVRYHHRRPTNRERKQNILLSKLHGRSQVNARRTGRDKYRATEVPSAGTQRNLIRNESTHQLQPAGVWIFSDVVPHVSVRHPFGHHAEGCRCSGDSKERNDVGMRNPLPHNRLLIKNLVVKVS